MVLLQGLDPLVALLDNVTAQGYVDILSTFLLPTIEDQFGYDHCVFQHDRAPVHTEGIVGKWLDNNNVPLMDWPAQSPDLNPIERIWDLLEGRFRARPHQLKSIPLLISALREEWAAISQETCRQLIESIPARVQVGFPL